MDWLIDVCTRAILIMSPVLIWKVIGYFYCWGVSSGGNIGLLIGPSETVLQTTQIDQTD